MNRIWLSGRNRDWRWIPRLIRSDAWTFPIDRIYRPSRNYLLWGRWEFCWWVVRYEADACPHGHHCLSGTPPIICTIDRHVMACKKIVLRDYDPRGLREGDR